MGSGGYPSSPETVYNNNSDNNIMHPFLLFIFRSIVYPQSYNLAVRQWNHNSNIYTYLFIKFLLFCGRVYLVPNAVVLIITIHAHNKIHLYCYIEMPAADIILYPREDGDDTITIGLCSTRYL